jgi:hypothetical protein
MVRQFGARVAMNTPIQGTAADIMKIAMINVYKELKNRGLQAKIVLQVHDEMMIEAPVSEAEEASREGPPSQGTHLREELRRTFLRPRRKGHEIREMAGRGIVGLLRSDGGIAPRTTSKTNRRIAKIRNEK